SAPAGATNTDERLTTTHNRGVHIMAKSHSTGAIAPMVAKNQKSRIPAGVAQVLKENQSRVREARAILELVSNTLCQETIDENWQGALMSAVDGALRILDSVDDLGDER